METLTMELSDIRAALTRIERAINTKIKEKPWLTKAEAMNELGCKGRKLQYLVAAGKIRVNSNPTPGKHLMYELKSIRKYITNPEGQ